MNNFKFKHKYKSVVGTILLIIFLHTYHSLVNAQDVGPDINLPKEVVKLSDVKAGTLLFRNGESGQYHIATRLNTHVEMHISGMVARVFVEQHYQNQNNDWLEGLYTFPLPEQAAVDQLQMHVGSRVIVGEIQEQQAAKKTYQQAKISGRRASLIEQQRPNLFTCNVANIAPNETIIIKISYLQTLKYDQGEFSIHFPMTLTSRYIAKTTKIIRTNSPGINHYGWGAAASVEEVKNLQPPMQASYDKNGQINNPASIKVLLDAGFPVDQLQSDNHAITDTYQNETIEINLARGVVPMEKDFVLRWKPMLNQAPGVALFNESFKSNDFALIMLLPPQNLLTENVLAREMIFVIDTSGSMGGESIKQAKEALLKGLEQLSSQDYFNIIQFNSITSQLYPQAVAFNTETHQQAINYVSTLRANGGTEMATAVRAALKNPSAQNMLRQIIFITDGAINNEDMLFTLIEQQLQDNRLFTVGIGSAPNRHFMAKAAEFGRGSSITIQATQQIHERMMQLFKKIKFPILMDLKLHWPDDFSVEVSPQHIKDLYMGEPILITAKLPQDFFQKHAKSNTKLWISGHTDDTVWKQSLALDSAKNHQGIAGLWARNKIDDLMNQMVREKYSAGSEQHKNNRQEIINLSLKHHLLSQYTSLVAVDKEKARLPQQALLKEQLTNVIPKGSASYPKGATAMEWHLLLGLLCLTMAMLFALFAYRASRQELLS